MPKNETLAKEAIKLIDELKELGVPEHGSYDDARGFIERTGNVNELFVHGLKMRKQRALKEKKGNE